MFWRMLVRTALVSLLAGLILVNSGSWLTDFYFGRTLRSVLGSSGQYDLLLAVRQGSLKAARKRMNEIEKEKLPGVSFQCGTTLPGKVYYFVSVPEKYQNQDFWSKLENYFGDIPGKIGYSVLLEPRLVIRDMPGMVLERIKKELEANLPLLRFAFREGSALVLVFQPEADLQQMKARTKTVLDKYSLLTVYPAGEAADRTYLNNKISNILRQELNLSFILPVRSQGHNLPALERVEDFLLAYSLTAAIDLRGEAITAPGDQVFSFAGDDRAVLQIIGLGDTWARAVLLQGRIETGNAVYDKSGKNVLGRIKGISSQLERVKSTLRQGEEFIQQLEDLREQGLEISTEHNWSEAEELLRKQDWSGEKEVIRNLEASLPRSEDLGELFNLLQEYKVQQGEGMTFIVSSSLAERKAEKLLQKNMPDKSLRAVKSPVGAIEIDLRGEMQRLIGDIREVMAFLLSVVYFLLVFFLDQSMVCRYLQLTRDSRRWLGLSSFYGLAWGMVFLPLLIWGSGGNLPYFNPLGWVILGGALGYFSAGKAAVFSPIKDDEVEAGISLGLNDAEIFNQIVIPEGKPGFFKLLFGRNILFGGKRRNAGD